jgi:hypothetical protein
VDWSEQPIHLSEWNSDLMKYHLAGFQRGFCFTVKVFPSLNGIMILFIEARYDGVALGRSFAIGFA